MWKIFVTSLLLTACVNEKKTAESVPSQIAPSQLQKATFAGGCFWCMEPPFEKQTGVYKVISGYTGGHKKDPTYKQVSYEKTGHVEAVEIHYDEKQISYEDLLEIFWRNVDPTDNGGQFVDRGESYKTAIFYRGGSQRKVAELSKSELHKSKRFKKPLVTPILEAKVFYPAEDYHQDYYKKNPTKYKYYRYRSGRDAFIDKSWGEERHYKPKKKTGGASAKPSKDELRARLTPLQYKVTQEDGTEPPFKNKYWDNKEPGIYVDIVSGEPLFSSLDKYKSGTGWPSFRKPLVSENILEKKDRKFLVTRTEVRSKSGDSHLGHVFGDGPKPTGLRYCLNSASLRFVPVKNLDKEGYGQFIKLFNVSK